MELGIWNVITIQVYESIRKMEINAFLFFQCAKNNDEVEVGQKKKSIDVAYTTHDV